MFIRREGNTLIVNQSIFEDYNKYPVVCSGVVRIGARAYEYNSTLSWEVTRKVLRVSAKKEHKAIEFLEERKEAT